MGVIRQIKKVNGLDKIVNKVLENGKGKPWMRATKLASPVKEEVELLKSELEMRNESQVILYLVEFFKNAKEDMKIKEYTKIDKKIQKRIEDVEVQGRLF